ncbi:DNA fragmentation factor subunit alpha [Nematostella vectensis]|uniref:DNA fragmentation factor subunit alpha n=1 Tax=Nematostella vectensis TaxID=45351 RepID=UPI00139016CA|nr:DNA fragmentation factor subunit alpha [Nematostella vectensis]
MAESDRRRRPFKVCNSQRSCTIGIVAESFVEMKARGSEKLNIARDCRVFLEEDGTEVDDEEYFSFLPDQTKLMLVEPGSSWTSKNEGTQICVTPGSFDASMERNESLDVDFTDAPEPDMARIAQRMQKDPLFFVSLPEDDLRLAIGFEPAELAAVLDRPEREASYYQETCRQELDRRTELREATELLKLYDKAVRQDIGNTEPGAKRPKN